MAPEGAGVVRLAVRDVCPENVR